MPYSWSDRRDASFRGVPFLLQTCKGKTGRRAIPHEYPKNNQGWAEDNGGTLNAEMIQAVLIGVNAQQDFEALIEALNTTGPGELIHPYFGMRQVQIGEVEYDLDNNKRDICLVSFQTFAANEALFPVEKIDTEQRVIKEANTANTTQCLCFENAFSTMSPDNMASLGDMLDNMLNDLDSVVNNLPGLPDAVGEWIGRIDRIKFSLSRALAYPGQLAKEITDSIFTIKDLSEELPLSLNVYKQLENKWTGLREELSPITSDTPAQTKKKNAQRVGVDLVLTAAVTAHANAVGSGTLVDSKDAQNTASLLTSSLAMLAEIAVDSGNTEGWRTLRKLRLSVAQDIQERIRQLPILRTVVIERAIPSALLAYQLTGDTHQRDDIVKRNRISRPSFICGKIDYLVKNNG